MENGDQNVLNSACLCSVRFTFLVKQEMLRMEDALKPGMAAGFQRKRWRGLVVQVADLVGLRQLLGEARKLARFGVIQASSTCFVCAVRGCLGCHKAASSISIASPIGQGSMAANWCASCLHAFAKILQL